MDKRATKKLELREEIFRSAMDLFRTQGFEETSIEQIAAAVGISPRTLFRHFATKADIVFMTAWQDLELLRHRVKLRPASEGPFKVVEMVALEHSEFMETRRETILEVAAMRQASPPLQQRRAFLMQVEFPQAVAQEFAARESGAEVAPEHLICARWLLCCLSLSLDEFVEDPSRSIRDITGELLDSIKDGFRSIL